MSDVGLEFLLVFLLIVANGIFAMSEIAIVTARKSRLQDLANKGNSKAKVALELANAPNQFLSTVQIGITLVGILAGAYGGRTIADRLATYLSMIPAIEPYSQTVALAAVVIAITYLSLIIGELVPKRFALAHPEKIATLCAFPMRVLSKLSSPAVRLLSLSTETVFRLFGSRSTHEPPVTEDEIKTLVEQGTRAGVFEESEQDMVEAVFRLGDKTARALMTPRKEIVWFDVNDLPEQIGKKISESSHSRFPVCDEDLNSVVGVAQAKDLLAGILTGHPIDLKTSVHEAAFIPVTMPGLEILEFIKESGSHIALVVDEYGGIQGLLTHHDILKAIAGEIPLGRSPAEPKAVQREDGSWLLDGMLSVDEFKEIFNMESLPGENRDAYQTLGGFVFTQMERIPAVSDHFEWNGLRFEIVDMDGERIDKVLVTAIHDNVTSKLGEKAASPPKNA